MARRVDQVEVVNLAVFGFVLQRSGLRFDSYPTLFLDVHRVEHLRLHLTFFKTATALNQSVCQRGFAMIDVGNDRKVSDVVHQREHLSG